MARARSAHVPPAPARRPELLELFLAGIGRVSRTPHASQPPILRIGLLLRNVRRTSLTGGLRLFSIKTVKRMRSLPDMPTRIVRSGCMAARREERVPRGERVERNPSAQESKRCNHRGRMVDRKRKRKPSVTPAKISAPRLGESYQRTRLFRALDDGRRKRVIFVAAPAGAGKTSLVASYLAARRLPALWYNVDARDADVANLFADAAALYHRVVEGNPHEERFRTCLSRCVATGTVEGARTSQASVVDRSS